MAELDVEKLRHNVIIKNVPKYGHVLIALPQKHTSHELLIRAEADGGAISAKLPLLYEGQVGLRLWRPDQPDPSDPNLWWDTKDAAFQDFVFHTDDFKQRKYIIEKHNFVDLTTRRTYPVNGTLLEKRRYQREQNNSKPHSFWRKIKELLWPSKTEVPQNMKQQWVKDSNSG